LSLRPLRGGGYGARPRFANVFRVLVKRLLWLPATLLVASLLTFLLLDLAPADRAAAELARLERTDVEVDRQLALERLRVRYGLIDPTTGERRDVITRWWSWVGHALQFDFAPPGERAATFRARLLRGIAISSLLGGLALLVIVALGTTLGFQAGIRVGSWSDRTICHGLLAMSAMSEFLVATLAVVVVSLWLRGVLPLEGLQSPEVANAGTPAKLFDLAAHLVLPVGVLSVGGTAWLARMVRAAVVETAASDHVLAMRRLGASERELRRSILRNSLSPVWSFLGMLLPWAIGGTFVVEHVFAIPGFGMLTVEALRQRDAATVLASTTVIVTVVAVASIFSDLLQQRGDPRVVLR
jgi:peptide/nickel transport system permease protein